MLPLLFVPTFLFGCNNNANTSSTYEIKTDNKVEVAYGENFKKTYESGELFSVDGLTLYFDGEELTDSSTYFFATSASKPVETEIDIGNDKVTGSSETSEVSFYAVYRYTTDTYYLSDAITITVQNSNAATPWVTTTVTTVVFLAIVVLISIKTYYDKKILIKAADKAEAKDENKEDDKE